MTDFYKDRVIWIIGASSGIGRTLAVQMAGMGARLALSARRGEELNALNADLGGSHLCLPLDVTDAATLSDAASRISTQYGRIDSVLFMAGVYKPGFYADLDLETIKRTVDINLMGALNTVSAALPVLTRQGGGQLVLCASVAGYRGLPNGQPYCATKAALISLAESLKIEQPKLDIKVICPGFVDTPMTAKNEFMMPMMVTADTAAKAIIRGLQTKTFEIHFPLGFTLFLKLLRILPNPLFFAAARMMAKVML